MSLVLSEQLLKYWQPLSRLMEILKLIVCTRFMLAIFGSEVVLLLLHLVLGQEPLKQCAPSEGVLDQGLHLNKH